MRVPGVVWFLIAACLAPGTEGCGGGGSGDEVPRPVADAGGDLEVIRGTNVWLDGAGSSDPEGENVAYEWTLRSRPTESDARLYDPATARPLFIADVAGEYIMDLVVTAGPRASGPDSVHVVAVDPPVGMFSPTDVYLVGTVAGSSCTGGGLAHWSMPDEAAVGFDCRVRQNETVVRPSDGRLLYSSVFEDALREFHCDDCPGWQPSDGYPSDYLMNDVILSTPPCEPDAELAFLLHPDGSVLHECPEGGEWYDDEGNVVHDGPGRLRHLGFNDLALTRRGTVVNLRDGSTASIDGLPTAEFLAVRALPLSGFWVAVESTAMPAGGNPELWEIDASGSASLVGVYPPLPELHQNSGVSWALNARGALFHFGWYICDSLDDAQACSDGISTDLIFRRTIGGTSDIVYTEASDPLVEIHISGLSTGP